MLHKTKTIEWFRKTGEYYILANEVNISGTFIIDEGFVQRISSLFISEKKEEIKTKDIFEYIQLIPKFDNILFFNRDFDKCLKSRINNPGFRLKDLTEKKIKEILKRNETILKFSILFLKTNMINIRFYNFYN